jgi:hypothetical protein
MLAIMLRWQEVLDMALNYHVIDTGNRRGDSFPEQKPEQDRIFHHVFKAAVNPLALAVSILAHRKAE